MRPKSTTTTTIATYGVLAFAGAVPMVMPEHLMMPSASGVSGTLAVNTMNPVAPLTPGRSEPAAATEPDTSDALD